MLAAVLCVGCGYSNPYVTPPPGAAEESTGGMISIHLAMWENNTNLFGYEAYINKALVHWLKKTKRFTLSPDSRNADYTLSGTIVSADFPGLSYGTFDRAIEVRAHIKFTYTLHDTKKDSVRLQRKRFSKRESFMVGTNATETDNNKRQAQHAIADDLAEEIYIQLTHSLLSSTQGS